MIAGELLDELPCFDDLFRVEAGRRLVEDEDVGIMDERLRQTDALLVAFRQLAGQPVRHVVDPRARHDVLDALAPLVSRHPFYSGDEIEILDDAHVGIERRRFRQVAGAPLGLERLVEDVEPGDNRLAFGGRHEPRQDPHRRRLAGPVGAEKAEDFAALDAEADIVDRGDAAVAFREVLDLNHRESPVREPKMLLRTHVNCVEGGLCL